MHRARILTTAVAAVVLLLTGVVAGFAAGGTGTVTPPPSVAFLATGTVAADSLAAGPIAGRLDAPLFTTRPTELSQPASDGIVALAPQLVIVLGGPGAINDDVVTALATATGKSVLAPETISPASDGIVRVFGNDRYETAGAIAELFSTFSPGFLPVDATALGALDADTATTATTADSATTAAGVDFLAPFDVTFDAPGEQVLASSGPLSIVAICESGDLDAEADGDDQALTVELRSTQDGWASAGNGGELLATDVYQVYNDSENDTSNVSAGYSDSSGGARSVDGDYIGLDDYHTTFTLNHGGSTCSAQGVAVVMPAPAAG